MSSNFAALKSAVLASSSSGVWSRAAREWELTRIDHDPRRNGVCVCGQTGLVDLFTIGNRSTGRELFPIGSTCINLFGREDLDRTADALSDLRHLRAAHEADAPIELSGEYFSRAALEHLYESGAFVPNQWNRGDGRFDYEFLLQMFNKRNKDAISSRQKAKIHVLLHRTILPFLRADPRLGG